MALESFTMNSVTIFAGLGILRIENKWIEVQRGKCELEQENVKLLRQIYDQQKQLSENEFEIIAEIERNKELTKKMNKNCGIVSCSGGRTHSLEKVAKHVHAVAEFSQSLSEEIEKVKGKLDQQFTQFERFFQDIGRLTEEQRLLEIAERDLERKVDKLSAPNGQDWHCSGAESSQVCETAKAALANKATHETTTIHSEKDKWRIKMLKQKLSRTYGMVFCGCRAVLIFLFTFLVLGFLFHFLLVSSSLRLPSTPADDYYGVDLFALWCYFVNWIFYLLVTE